jgi:hypothetical protein
LASLAAFNGGYFPTSWGWVTLALALVAGFALVSGPERPSRLELVALAALTVFVGWTAISAAWSVSDSSTVLEIERALIYPLGLLAALLVTTRRSTANLLAGVLLAVTGVAIYSLVTRLFPDRIGAFDPVAGYRLSEPMGYWNALAIFTAMGALIAVGFAARAKSLPARAAAAAALPILLTTQYFTFSRGAWIALGVGVAGALAVDPRRTQLVSAVAVLLPFPFIAVWLASRLDALTHESTLLGPASREGHRLALWIILLAVGCSAAAGAFALAEGRVHPSRRMRLLYVGSLFAAALGACAAVVATYGGPVSLSQRIYDEFRAPPAAIGGNLNRRLFDLSGNGRVDMWRLAANDFRAHRLLGAGAGTYEQYWFRHRPYAGQVRDAHSLYLEVLAELGPLGLAFLLIALAIPLLALAQARGEPLLIGGIGAYVAFLAHAAVDWDWEVPAVTLTALFCGAAILVSARRPDNEQAESRWTTIVPLAALVGGSAAFAFVGLLGNSKLAAARAAADDGRWKNAATTARSASRWAPWSAEPWELIAFSQLARRQLRASRASFRKAISHDPNDWTLWFELAQASDGAARARALGEARRLNPRSPEIAAYVATNQRTTASP